MRHKFDLQNLTILGGVAVIAIVGILLVTPPPSEPLPVATPTPAGLQMDTLIYSTIAQSTLYTPTPERTLIYTYLYGPVEYVPANGIRPSPIDPTATPTSLPLTYNYTPEQINAATGRHSMNQRHCCKGGENGGESLDWTREKQMWNWLKISAKYHAGNVRYEWDRREQHIAAVEQRIERTWKRFAQ